MKTPTSACRQSLAAVLALLATSCVSYHTQDAVRVQDEVVQDSFELEMEVIAIEPPNLVLRLQPGGEKTIRRTTITDRTVHYDIHSGLLEGIEDVGFNPPIVFVIPFGLVSDLAQLLLSAPTQLPAGWWASIDPPATQTTFTTAQPGEIRSHEEVRVRFGPRLLESALTRDGNRVVVDASRAANTLLSLGKTEMPVHVRLPNGDLHATVTLSHAAMLELASQASPLR